MQTQGQEWHEAGLWHDGWGWRGGAGVAAATTAPWSPVPPRYDNQVARAAKMLRDSRDISLIPLDYSPVTGPLGLLLSPSAPALKMEPARGWRCSGTDGTQQLQPELETGGQVGGRLTAPGPLLPGMSGATSLPESRPQGPLRLRPPGRGTEEGKPGGRHEGAGVFWGTVLTGHKVPGYQTLRGFSQ